VRKKTSNLHETCNGSSANYVEVPSPPSIHVYYIKQKEDEEEEEEIKLHKHCELAVAL
jgi:hypothetical protein